MHLVCVTTCAPLQFGRGELDMMWLDAMAFGALMPCNTHVPLRLDYEFDVHVCAWDGPGTGLSTLIQVLFTEKKQNI